MSRTIPLHEYPVPDNRVSDWLEANDVDPKDVVAASIAMVSDGFVAFVGFHRDEAGNRAVQGSDESTRVMIKVPIVVPLKSAPEAHGL